MNEVFDLVAQDVHQDATKGPKIFIHDDFSYITISQEKLAELFRSFRPDISDNELNKWQVDVTPFAAQLLNEEGQVKRHKIALFTVNIDKRNKQITFHPDVPGYKYFQVAPEVRRKLSDQDKTIKRRERRRLNRQLKALENVPELGESVEDHVKNIEEMLNTYLYDAVDSVFYKSKNELTSLAKRMGMYAINYGGRLLLFKILFDVNVVLAVSVGIVTSLGISLPLTRRIVRNTEMIQKEKAEVRKQERKEIVQHLVTVHE